MKKFNVLFICFLFGLNCIIMIQSRLAASTGLSESKSFTLGEEVVEFDCWSRMIINPEMRVLECNVPCCYRDGYDAANASSPNGKCTYGQGNPEGAELLNEMGGIPNCNGGGGPDM
jgi:hypothetical protein